MNNKPIINEIDADTEKSMKTSNEYKSGCRNGKNSQKESSTESRKQQIDLAKLNTCNEEDGTRAPGSIHQGSSKMTARSSTAKQKQKNVSNEGESSDEVSCYKASSKMTGEAGTYKSRYDISIPLVITAAINSPEKMRHYFEKDPSSGRSSHDPNGRCLHDGSTPLHLAIRAKHLEVVKILVQNGANIALTDSAGDNILMRAIKSSDANIINTVWPYRTDLNINHTNVEGMSALHLAAEQKWECCLNFLLQNKADPNIQNTKTGITPLMIAAANGDTNSVDYLLRAGAEVLMEDNEGFTCFFKAFKARKGAMIKHLLRHICEEDREMFIKARLDYIQSPPIADEEKTLLADKYLPLLVECTNFRELRPAMYNQKVIHRIAYKMEEHIQSVDIVISGSHLLFCIMFKFGDPIDLKFLRQYLNCKGPDLTIEVTKYYTEVWKMSERSIIAVFLPMIGLAVIPEGRTWIKKHYLSVSEYINFFKKENLKQYIAPNPEFGWCLTKAHFGKIYKVWNHFYDVVNEIQTEQRERNMNELLEEEEREKERQVRKKQKKKQKKQDKQKKEFENVSCHGEESTAKPNIPAPLDCDKSCVNEKAEKVEKVRNEVFLHKDGNCNSKVVNKVYLVEPEFPTVCDQWKTVQAKKNSNRERANLSNKTSLDHENSNVAETPSRNKGKHGQKQEHPPQNNKVQSLNCNSKTRWADVAKVKPRVMESKTDNQIKILKRDSIDQTKPVQFVAADFPSLLSDAQVKKTEDKKKNDTPGVFTFYFHEECNTLNGGVLQRSLESNEDGSGISQTSIDLVAEPADQPNSIAGEDSVIDQTPTHWTWETVAEIGEFGRENFTEVLSQTDTIIQTKDPAENLSYLPNSFQDDETFNETEFRKQTDIQVETFNETESRKEDEIQVETYCNGNTYKPLDPVSNSLHMQTVVQEIDSSTGDIFKNIEDNVPIWADELQGFCDKVDSGNSAFCDKVDGGNSAFCDKVDGGNSAIQPQNTKEMNIDSDRVITDGSVAQDLVYFDPAIIGCGALHKPLVQTASTSCTSTAYRPLQKSRFLGNVIVNEPRSLQGHDTVSTHRAHKGWSNKRRMKTRHEDGLPLSTKNWSFGEKLLENAHQLEKEMAIEGICYPDSLSGDKEKEETHYFPSFHDETRLSRQVDPSKFSLVHRIQLMQLAERQDYIEKSIKSTHDETLFAYYASCAGLNRQQYYQLIEHRRNTMKARNNNPTKDLLEVHQFTSGHEETNPARKPSTVCVGGKSMGTLASGDKFNTLGLQTAAVNLYNFQSWSMGCKVLQEESEAITVDPESLGISVPAQDPEIPEVPGNQANIYAIQSAQSAMQMEVTKQIRNIFADMLQDKIKSVRWKDSLWKMRNIPVEKQMIISKMVIPADESDRSYISVTRSDSTVLGFLTDGTEVAIKVIDGQTREFTQKELQYLVDMDVSKYFMVKYKKQTKLFSRHVHGNTCINLPNDKILDMSKLKALADDKIKDYCFHDGIYYIAQTLYEYTLTDYLIYLKQTFGRERLSTTYSKLIWQLLRGLENLHQNCLMVHGELRPENIVIDTDGNIRITGYGLGKNVGREGPFLDYTDEEKCWLAPEVLVHKQKVSFKSDIWVAGMLIYYILSNGKNPFGSEVPSIIWNIGNQGYVMEYINEEAGHLLCMMMSINKSERPCISETLKHPYFWGQEKQLRLIIIAGSDVLRDVKAGIPMNGSVKESMISIIGTSPCHLRIVNWIPEIEPIVMREMKAFRQYKNNVVELVLFVYNCCTHFDSLSESVREIIEEPCKYFLTKFPTLFMTLYRAIKNSSKAERACYKAFL